MERLSTHCIVLMKMNNRVEPNIANEWIGTDEQPRNAEYQQLNILDSRLLVLIDDLCQWKKLWPPAMS